MAQRDGGADKRTVAPAGPLLEVEEKRGATEETLLAVPKKNRGTPLRAAHGPGLETPLINKCFKTPHQLNRACVIKTLKHLD